MTFSLCSIPTSVVNAAEVVGVTEVTPRLIILATASGNVVTSVGPDGALLVGTPSAASTSQISSILAKRTRSAIRYVVISPEDLAHSDGDAGWQSRGAFVAMGGIEQFRPYLTARGVGLSSPTFTSIWK